MEKEISVLESCPVIGEGEQAIGNRYTVRLAEGKPLSRDSTRMRIKLSFNML